MCEMHGPHAASKKAKVRSVHVEGQPPPQARGSTPAGSTATPTLFRFESDLAEELSRKPKRAREDDVGDIVLGNRTPQQLRPNLLGPILKKRFLGGKA